MLTTFGAEGSQQSLAVHVCFSISGFRSVIAKVMFSLQSCYLEPRDLIGLILHIYI